MTKLKNFNCTVEDEYFLGFTASKDTVLSEMIEEVNQILKEEFGDEFKVVRYIYKEELHPDLEDYYILKTNLPYNLFSLKDNNSIPKYMVFGGWLGMTFLKKLLFELIYRNDCLHTGNYKNRYGLDEEEVKTFFKEYEKYIHGIYVTKKNCIENIWWEDLYVNEEHLEDFYTIYEIVWEKEPPFTKLNPSSFGNISNLIHLFDYHNLDGTIDLDKIEKDDYQEIRNWMHSLIDDFDRINPNYRYPLSMYIKTHEDVDLIPDDKLKDYEYSIMREFELSDVDAEPSYIENEDE